MFNNIGFPEILVILGVLFIFFGPKKLSEIGRELGKAIREFKTANEEYEETVEEIKKPIKQIKQKPKKFLKIRKGVKK